MNLYGVLTCLAGLLTVVTCCDPVLIDSCTDSFARDIGISRERLDEGLLPAVTEESLKRVCKAYDNFEVCVKSYRGYCPTAIRTQLEGLENLYDYLCGDGFELHLKYESCLSSQDVEDNVIECSERISQQFDRPLLDKGDVCDILKDTLDCTESAVKSECGSEAAEHQVEIDKLFIQPLADEIDCNLDGTNIGLIVGVVAAIVVIIVICITICLCCARKKNRRRFDEENQQQQMNVVTQPGATAPSYPGSVVAPPAYEYQDPTGLHNDKPPIYDNHTYAVPDVNGTDNHAYADLPGKE